jgi:hypothetical protein
MRHPKQKALLLFLAAPVAAVISLLSLVGMEIAHRNNVEPSMVYILLALFGAAGAVVSLIVGIVAAIRARTESRLQAGLDAIAKWRVSDAEWSRFLAHDAARSNRLRSLRNRLKFSPSPPGTSVEVIFGPSAVLIDGFVQPLRLRTAGQSVFNLVDVAWIEGDPPSIEFHGFTRTINADVHKSHITVARFPVSNMARDAGLAVVAHYAAVIPAATTEKAHIAWPDHFAAARE